MNPITSVIIPCYNGEAYLTEALESICCQTSPVREIIVVDDGSDIPVRAPADWNGPSLCILRTPNRGLAAARNLGLTHAAGELIAFLDADDFWHPRKVEEQERALRSDPGAVACYTRCVQAPGFFGFGPYPRPDVCDDEFLLVLWYHPFFPPSAVSVRRDALTAVGPFRDDMGNGEDVELWLRLLQRGRFIQVPEPLCYYRQHANQFTKNVYRKWIGAKRAYGVMIARHADRLIRAGLRDDQLWDAYRTHILLVYYRRQFESARKLLWNYWRDHPLDLEILGKALLALLPAGLVASLRGRLPSEASASGASASGPNEDHRDWHDTVSRLRPVLGGEAVFKSSPLLGESSR